MSLFSIITWWSARVSDNGQDTSLVLCVSRFNSFEAASDQVEKDTIFVGSSSGMLSIYQPSDVFYITGHNSPTDVIMECQLNDPIIDLKCGKFAMTKSERYSIAVLHPHRVACFNITFAEGIAEYGKQFRLSLVFESDLSSAFTLCKGPFGGVKSKEFFCVGHLTSKDLRFFEQDGMTTDCRLPDAERTLPSHVLYLSRVDCFAVVSMPDNALECYKYQDLITSTEQNPTAPVWTFCVGEFVLEMATHQTSNSESVVLLLCENTLICITDGGVLKFIRKLDYTPVTFHTFVIGYYFEPDALRLMIAVADVNSLFVYEAGSGLSAAGPLNCKLIWSTQLPFAPVAMARANFDGLPGGLVLLGETSLTVAFFGTDPLIYKAPLTTPESHLQIESAQRQLSRLEEDIKVGIDFTDVSFINSATNRDLQVLVNSSSRLSPCDVKNFQTVNGQPNLAMRVQLKLKANVAFDQIQIAINAPPPYSVTENSFMFLAVDAGQELEWECAVYMSMAENPQSLSIPLIVSMINRGLPRIIEKSISVNPQLLLRQCSPQKEGRYKVTVSAESSSSKEILLMNLFPEFAVDTINQQALGLKSIHSGDIVTIVLGKNSNRYRVQSDNLSAIAFVTEMLLERLKKAHKPSITPGEAASGITISQSYFIDELLEGIEIHWQRRKEVKDRDQDITKKSRQMRLFQRKLALRLQQDPPHPTYNSAAKLLRLTHADLSELQEKLLVSVDQLRKSQISLGNHWRLINLNIHHSTLPAHLKDNLLAFLFSPINDWIDMSWEETMVPGMEMMSHIGPLGKRKDGNNDIEDVKSFYQLPFDPESFRKNLKYVLEKIASGDVEDVVASEAPVNDSSDWLNRTDEGSLEAEDENVMFV